jgi:dienelactone hydrolase
MTRSALRLLLVLPLACASSPAGNDAGPGTDGGGDAGERWVDAGTDAGHAGNDGGADGGLDAGVDGGPQWISVQVLEQDAGYEIDWVSYASDGLQVNGQLCRPTDAGPYPVIVRNHGGFAGLTTSVQDSFCRGAAQNGYVVLDASYRGEDGSQGQVEVCLGEVDDVEAMVEVARNQPYVDLNRFAAFGGSHGGCITLRLIERDNRFKAAVDLFGPTDLAPLFDFWESELDAGEPFPCPTDQAPTCTAVHQSLISTVVTATGGTPAQVPQAYAARSAVLALGGTTVPLLILHGTDDYLVDLPQTCEARAAFADAGAAPLAWYLDAQLQPASSPLCGGGFIIDAGVPAQVADWSASNRYLLIYQGQGHGFTGDGGVLASYQALTFLLSRL